MALHVEAQGPTNAPTIVFVTGGMMGPWMWDETVRSLPDYHCLVIDFPDPGHRVGKLQFSIQDSAARLAEAIRTRAHGGRAHVVGYCLGAQIIIAMMNLLPDLVDHAVLSGALLGPLPGFRPAGRSARVYQSLRTLGLLLAVERRRLSVPRKYAADFASYVRSMGTETLVRIRDESLTFRLPPRIERVSIPTLVLVGKRESRALVQSARVLAAVVSSARAYAVDSDQRSWIFRAPELYAQIVRAWISDEPLPRQLQPLSARS
jgi:pimeloyl-ACP methyl ester carboxylesterase